MFSLPDRPLRGFPIPRIHVVTPDVTPPLRAANLVVSGRDLPLTDVVFTILDPEGESVVVTPLEAIEIY